MRSAWPFSLARAIGVAAALILVVLASHGCGSRGGDGGGSGARPRLLVIGLDGASWSVIEPWIGAGHLPNIARLRERGVWGDLASVTPPLSAPAWTTAVTGVNPGQHGVLNFVLVDPADYSQRMATARDRRVPAIWEYLTREGKTSGIVNIPLTSPADSLNGFMIGGFPHLDTTGIYFPHDLAAGIERAAGPILFDDYGEQLPPGREIEELDRLLRTIESKRAVSHHLMTTRDWDLFWVVFLASDKVHHFYWQYNDSLHPAYDANAPARLQGAMLEVWIALDRAVGELVAAAGKNATVLILSDHGSGPVRREFRLLNWLAREGYAHPDLRESRVLAFQPYGGDIYIHDARFANGIVADSMRAPLVDEIVGKLEAIRDPEASGDVLAPIHRRQEVYRGPAAAGAPDILFEGAPGWLVSRGKGNPAAPLFGPPAYTFSGYHLPDGILLATGPGVAAPGRIEGARLIDITPTLLYFLNCDIPKAIEGSVLSALVPPERFAAAPPRIVDVEIERATEETEAIRAIPYIR
ncbi:MAG: alkaline phosphatase family protein [bacterium]